MMLRVVGGLLAVLLPFAARAGEGATRVAVVDVSTVFKNYKKVYDVQRAIDASFEQERRKLDDETRKLKEEIRETEQMRRDSAGNSDFLFERVQSLQKREFSLRKRQQVFEQNVNKRYLDEMRDVLNEIHAAVRKSAEQGKFDLVVRAADADDPVTGDESGANAKSDNDKAIRDMLEPKHTLDLVIRFKRNPVLYGSPLVDLTQDVLKELNDQYAKRSSGAPANK